MNGPGPKRGPGRPQGGGGKRVSRSSILRAALKLAITTPLQDLSIVTVAKSMGVTSALIHYYVGGRAWLTSGVMNLFYKDLIRKWPEPTGEWRRDLTAAARAIFEHFSRYGGIAAYAVSNSRFRVFQLTAFGDRDYGVEVLDRFTGLVRASGLSAERTGIYSNQFMEFIINTGHGTAQHIFPSDHREFLDKKSSTLDVSRYPNIDFAKRAPLMIDGELAFREGCNLYMLGIVVEASGKTLDEVIGMQAADAPRSRRTIRRAAA